VPERLVYPQQEGGSGTVNRKTGSEAGREMNNGTDWREDVRIALTIFGVLFLVALAAALSVQSLLRY